MDENEYLILINDKDKTSEIAQFTDSSSKITIRFHRRNKDYSYGRNRVQVLKEPKLIEQGSCLIYLDKKALFNIVKVLDFSSHVKVFYGTKISVYAKNRIHYEYNALNDSSVEKKFTYLKSLAQYLSDEKNDFLEKQYEKLEHINEESVLAQYLKPDTVRENNFDGVMVFPFGFNLSQEVAVLKALSHQISIIEGPPGTGKTQTILNIIANLVMQDKTVAIASNNNTAIINVFDKLETNDLSFISAVLGNKENKNTFIENQSSSYPNIIDTAMTETLPTFADIEVKTSQIKEMLHSQNELAKALPELEALTLEKKHFLRLYEKRAIRIKDENFLNYSSEKILSLWAELEYLQATHKRVTLLFKIKAFFKYKIFSSTIYRYSLDDIIAFLQSCFYDIKEKEFQKNIAKLEKRLEKYDFDNALIQHKEQSMYLFKSYLVKRYGLKKERKQFSNDDLWKNFSSVVKEYPVILSTTHALRSSSGQNFIYDYLIIDEASQVDLVSGSLALSYAKNIVIVGDLKQLSNIIKNTLQENVNHIFAKHKINPAYHYNNSLLLSASILFPNAPKTLLKEHYRCHPQIIDFCNKKFYNNELIILSKNDNEISPLVLYNTALGNHARGTYNQRQIDVITKEILPTIPVDADIGIISPYRKQVNLLDNEVASEFEIEIDTVHKYQGREKDIIILTTVVDKENEFADDPNLLNVAISRAKHKLYVVVSDSGKNRHMKDLVTYIKYNNLEIQESQIYSIFDLLYQNYAPHLTRYLEKMKDVSTYKSENLMNAVVANVMNSARYSHLGWVLHLSLNRLICDTSLLTEKELMFVQNPATHIDFLIYNKIDKQAVLALEVDGVAFHENNPAQLKRDALKNHILQKYNIPMMRFATNGSDEEQKLLKKLKEISS